jgi:hypothetical protein
MSLFNQGTCDKAFNKPYRGNLECLKSVRKAKAKDMPNIANIPINTTDSFPAREGYVVILVLGVNESNSLRFVANKNRICVGTTRHIGASLTFEWLTRKYQVVLNTYQTTEWFSSRTYFSFEVEWNDSSDFSDVLL